MKRLQISSSSATGCWKRHAKNRLTAAGEQIVKEAREKAAAEADKIIADAKLVIEQQREDALSAVREEVAKVAIAVAEKILRSELTDKEGQQAYIGKLVDETKESIKGGERK